MSWAGRRLLLLATFALAAMASAQCVRAPEDSELTVPGFIVAYYRELRTDLLRDLVDFTGGVCVTAENGEWTMQAQSVRLSGMTTELRLTAPEPTFRYGSWTISAALLTATTTSIVLVEARVAGEQASGSAETISVDINTGQMSLTGLQLASSVLAVRGEGAVLLGETLTLEGAGVTTCILVESPAFEVEGAVAEVDWAAGNVVIEAAALVLGPIRLPLSDRLVINETSFANYQFPLQLQYVSDGPAHRARPGAGLGLRLAGLRLAEGVSIDLGATGIDTEHEFGFVTLLRAAAQLPSLDPELTLDSWPMSAPATVQAVAGLEAGRPFLELSLRRPIRPWLSLNLGILSGARPAQDNRYEGSLSLLAERTLPRLRGRIAAQVFAAATAVAPARSPTEPSVIGARLGAQLTGRVASANTRIGAFALDYRLDGTLYPHQDASQWGVRLVPSWRYTRGPLNVTLSHDAWFTNSGSPFGTAVDRLGARQRSELNLRLAGTLYQGEPPAAGAGGPIAAGPGSQGPGAAPGPTLTGSVEFRVSHDLIPVEAQGAGLRIVRATGQLRYLAEPWTVSATAVLETAGLFLPQSGRDAFVLVNLAATRTGWPVFTGTGNVPHSTFEVGLITTYGIGQLNPGLRRLELRTAVPLTFDHLELRPFVAFDFAPTVNAGLWPEWSGHGVDLTFITCCGSFTIGYLNDRGVWSASASIDLARRPPKR